MVFQRPNPLPISIRENVLFGCDLHAPTGDMFVTPRERQTADYVEDRYG